MYTLNPIPLRPDGSIDEEKMKKFLVLRKGKFAWVRKFKSGDKKARSTDMERIKQFDVPTIPLDREDIRELQYELTYRNRRTEAAERRKNEAGETNNNNNNNNSNNNNNNTNNNNTNAQIPERNEMSTKDQRYRDKENREDEDQDFEPPRNNNIYKDTNTTTYLSPSPTNEVGGGGVIQEKWDEMCVNELIFSMFNLSNECNENSIELNNHKTPSCNNEINVYGSMLHDYDGNENTMSIENDLGTHHYVATTDNNNVKCVNVNTHNKITDEKKNKIGLTEFKNEMKPERHPISIKINEDHYTRLPAGVIPVGDFENDEMEYETRTQLVSYFNANRITNTYCVICDSFDCACIEVLPQMNNKNTRGRIPTTQENGRV